MGAKVHSHLSPFLEPRTLQISLRRGARVVLPQSRDLVPGKRNSKDTSDLSQDLAFSSPAPSLGPDLLLLGSVIRMLAQTVSVGWHCFGAQWLELARVQSWHHRPWARQGTERGMTRGTGV